MFRTELIIAGLAYRIDVITSTDEEDWPREVLPEDSIADVEETPEPTKLWALLAAAAGAAILILGGVFFKDQIASFLTYFTETVDELGPAGYVLYFFVYAALEVLAVPAIPLTMASGAIFGIVPGSILVSLSATTAATVSFLIARYLARDKVCRPYLMSGSEHGIQQITSCVDNSPGAVFGLGSTEQAVPGSEHCHREGWLQSGSPAAAFTLVATGSLQLSVWFDKCFTSFFLSRLLGGDVPRYSCVCQRRSCRQGRLCWWRGGTVTEFVAGCARVCIDRRCDRLHWIARNCRLERGRGKGRS